MGFGEVKVTLYRDNKIVLDEKFLCDDFTDPIECSISSYCEKLASSGEYSDGIELEAEYNGYKNTYITSSKQMTVYKSYVKHPDTRKAKTFLNYQKGVSCYEDDQHKLVVKGATDNIRKHVERAFPNIEFSFW